MASPKIVIDTQGICILCLKLRPREEIICDEEVSAKVASYKMLIRYLEINVNKVIQFAPEFPVDFVDKLKVLNGDLGVILCQNCDGLMEQFSKWYESLEAVRLCLDGCLNTIFEVVKESEDRSGLMRRLAIDEDMGIAVNFLAAINLRTETIRKCLVRLSSKPLVVLNKIPEIHVEDCSSGDELSETGEESEGIVLRRNIFEEYDDEFEEEIFRDRNQNLVEGTGIGGFYDCVEDVEDVVVCPESDDESVMVDNLREDGDEPIPHVEESEVVTSLSDEDMDEDSAQGPITISFKCLETNSIVTLPPPDNVADEDLEENTPVTSPEDNTDDTSSEEDSDSEMDVDGTENISKSASEPVPFEPSHKNDEEIVVRNSTSLVDPPQEDNLKVPDKEMSKKDPKKHDGSQIKKNLIEETDPPQDSSEVPPQKETEELTLASDFDGKHNSLQLEVNEREKASNPVTLSTLDALQSDEEEARDTMDSIFSSISHTIRTESSECLPFMNHSLPSSIPSPNHNEVVNEVENTISFDKDPLQKLAEEETIPVPVVTLADEETGEAETTTISNIVPAKRFKDTEASESSKRTVVIELKVPDFRKLFNFNFSSKGKKGDVSKVRVNLGAKRQIEIVQKQEKPLQKKSQSDAGGAKVALGEVKEVEIEEEGVMEIKVEPETVDETETKGGVKEGEVSVQASKKLEPERIAKVGVNEANEVAPVTVPEAQVGGKQVELNNKGGAGRVVTGIQTMVPIIPVLPNARAKVLLPVAESFPMPVIIERQLHHGVVNVRRGHPYEAMRVDLAEKNLPSTSSAASTPVKYITIQSVGEALKSLQTKPKPAVPSNHNLLLLSAICDVHSSMSHRPTVTRPPTQVVSRVEPQPTILSLLPHPIVTTSVIQAQPAPAIASTSTAEIPSTSTSLFQAPPLFPITVVPKHPSFDNIPHLDLLQTYSEKLPPGTTTRSIAYATKTIVDRHMQDPSNIFKSHNVACLLCKQIFPQRSQLSLHIIYSHFENIIDVLNEPIRRPVIFSSSQGEFILPSSLSLPVRPTARTLDHMCFTCTKSFCNLSELNDHRKEHVTEYPCQLCPQRFLVASKLQRHLEQAHPKGSHGGEGGVEQTGGNIAGEDFIIGAEEQVSSEPSKTEPEKKSEENGKQNKTKDKEASPELEKEDKTREKKDKDEEREATPDASSSEEESDEDSPPDKWNSNPRRSSRRKYNCHECGKRFVTMEIFLRHRHKTTIQKTSTKPKVKVKKIAKVTPPVEPEPPRVKRKYTKRGTKFTKMTKVVARRTRISSAKERAAKVKANAAWAKIQARKAKVRAAKRKAIKSKEKVARVKTEATKPDPEVKPTRGRGRPRKYPKVEPSQSPEKMEESPEKVEASPEKVKESPKKKESPGKAKPSPKTPETEIEVIDIDDMEMEVDTPPHNPDQSQSFQCPHCDKIFLRKNKLVHQHFLLHHSVKYYKATYPDDPILSELSEEGLEEAVQKLIDSMECYQDGSIRCSICQRALFSIKIFRMHVLTQHSKAVQKLLQENSSRLSLEKRFTCSKCPETFSSWYCCDKHEKTHKTKAPPKTFSCLLCDFKTDTKHLRLIHLTEKHTSEYFSEKGYAGYGKDELNTAVKWFLHDCRLENNKRWRWKCCECFKTFSLMHTLKLHATQKHPDAVIIRLKQIQQGDSRAARYLGNEVEPKPSTSTQMINDHNYCLMTTGRDKRIGILRTTLTGQPLKRKEVKPVIADPPPASIVNVSTTPPVVDVSPPPVVAVSLPQVPGVAVSPPQVPGVAVSTPPAVAASPSLAVAVPSPVPVALNNEVPKEPEILSSEKKKDTVCATCGVGLSRKQHLQCIDKSSTTS